MTSLEKDLLIRLRDTLSKSTEVEWEIGDLEDWSDWARKMKNNIKTACVVFDAMIKQPLEVVEEKKD